MKLDNWTLQVLKNFNVINPAIMLKPGNSISTVSPSKQILARARIQNEFNTTFCIGELSRFLGVLSLYQNPEIEFHDNYLIIADEKSSLKYIYSEPSVLILPKKDSLDLPAVDLQFTLTQSMLDSMGKALAVLGVSEMAVCGDGSKMSLQAVDSSGAIKDMYSIDLGETDKTFRIIFNKDNLKLLQFDYNVNICFSNSKGLGYFKSVNNEVEYWIAIDLKSTFGE